MDCPICSDNGDTVCNNCKNTYGTKTLDGKNIEFGFFSSSNIFFSKIEGSNLYTQDIICYVNGKKCIVNEKTLKITLL